MGRIRIVGTGLQGERHLTLEAVDALASAERVYHLVSGREAAAALARFNLQLYPLFDFYREGVLDLEVYSDIASFLIAEGQQRDIVFAVMGHPCIYVAPTHLLLDHGPRWGVAVEVMAGISTIDAMILNMPDDIGNTGLQILDANRLVSYGLTPDPRVPMLLFQIGCFGSGYITRCRENSDTRLAPLAAVLGRHYPAGHLVYIVEYGMGFPHTEQCHAIPLALLGEAGALVNYNSTLLVPPSQRVTVVDPHFQARLIDPAFVPSVVR